MSKSEMEKLGDFIREKTEKMWDRIADKHLYLSKGERLAYDIQKFKSTLDGALKETKELLKEKKYTDEELEQIDALEAEVNRLSEESSPEDLEKVEQMFLSVLDSKSYLTAQDEAIVDLFESALHGEYEPQSKEEIEGMVEGESKFLETLKGNGYAEEGLKEIEEKFTEQVTGKPTKDIEAAEKNFLKNLE
jgi:hypothetical protein